MIIGSVLLFIEAMFLKYCLEPSHILNVKSDLNDF